MKKSDHIANGMAGHSNLQMDCFVTAKNGLTPWGMYMQACLELGTRERGIESTSIELEKAKLDASGPRFTKRGRLQRVESEYRVKCLARSIQDTSRERDRFFMQCENLIGLLPSDIEANRDRLDAEFWNVSIRGMIALDIMSTGRVGVDKLALVQSLPANDRRELLKDIVAARADATGLIDWFMNIENHTKELSQGASEQCE